MKRIWIKPDGREWIRKRIQKTTFRKNMKEEGIYEVVEGSIYNPKSVGMWVKLTPLKYCSLEEVISNHYSTEGDFKSPEDFVAWLKANKLKLPDEGYLHGITMLEERGGNINK